MPNEINIRHSFTSPTLYGVIANHAGQYWRTDTETYEIWTPANWANYVISLTETTRVWQGSIPSGFSQGSFIFHEFQRTGGTESTADDYLGSYEWYWDGSVVSQRAWLPSSSALAVVDGIVDAIVADTNELQTDWTDGGRLDLLLDATLTDTNELQTDWVNGGRLDLLLDAVLADTNELQTDLTDGGRLDLIFDGILADTNELQLDWTDGGRLDLLLDAVLADTNELQTDWTDSGRLDTILDEINLHTPYQYWASVAGPKSSAAEADIWGIQWFRNCTALTSGVTSPKITVIDMTDGSTLINNQDMTQVAGAGDGAFRYTASNTERYDPGKPYLVTVSAQIAYETRTWKQVISRDV